MSEEVKKEVKQDNSIQISEDVVANIAGMAIEGIKGIAEMSGGFAGGISEVLSGKKNMAKGIKVDIKEGKAKIDVNIIVEYGSRIPDVAYEIQVKSKKAVEDMTGLKVDEVNVHVQGVSTPSKKKEEKKEDTKKEVAKKPAAKKTTTKKTTKK
jgi:uncharacterized alkaline shock family protein YloU